MVALLLVVCIAMSQDLPSTDREHSLKHFLRNYIGIPDKETGSTRYSAAFVSLRDNSRDAIVYLSGNGWCGSGGCTTLILISDSKRYKAIARIPASKTPIRVLPSKHYGWRDICLVMRGNGAESPREVIFTFNGKSYVRASKSGSAYLTHGGSVAISDESADEPLYQ